MKILCVIDYLCAGGAQRQLVNMSIEFKARGHQVEFLVYHEHDFFKSVLQEHQIPINLVKSDNYFFRLIKMRKFIRNFNADVVISFLEAASFICEISSLPTKKFKLIVGERNANPNILISKKLRFYRRFHGLADYIVANSTNNIELVKQINQSLPENKLKVIYNMVDIDKWQPNLNYKYLDNGKLKLVVLARYHVSKNILGLLRAISSLDLTLKNRLIVDWYGEVGDDSYEKGIFFIKENNLSSVVTLHKQIKDVLPVIQNADCVGLFSFYEGLPNAMCEAMAVGKPIMYSNVSDLPKIIDVDNYCFAPEKDEEIKKVIEFFLSLTELDLQKIGEKNRRIALDTFSKENVVNAYMNLFS
ncbi:glycosyltransferase [Sphingobacterium sp. HMA12]|uniref:glycosyltransferase n=1 Tax=Sphingobacterium sp. HMA12 TaxID=2050894 RepID=UPI000CEA4D73|nr:glycosyltransferase [Sphingobacterium sp. HMA12]